MTSDSGSWMGISSVSVMGIGSSSMAGLGTGLGRNGVDRLDQAGAGVVCLSACVYPR